MHHNLMNMFMHLRLLLSNIYNIRTMKKQNVSINGVGECHTLPNKEKTQRKREKIIQNHSSIAIHYGIRFIDSVKARKTITDTYIKAKKKKDIRYHLIDVSMFMSQEIFIFHSFNLVVAFFCSFLWSIRYADRWIWIMDVDRYGSK